jgi:hypothetical protein
MRQAIEFSKQNAHFKPELATIYQATYGVVFFGTPHRGSDVANLGVIAATACKVIGKETNTNLLRSLEKSSEVLVRISDAFAKLLATREVKVHSFLEDRSVPMVGKVWNRVSLVKQREKTNKESGCGRLFWTYRRCL